MAVADNVFETFTTSGTGTLTLAGAYSSAYQTFAAGLAANTELTPASPLAWSGVYYMAYSLDGNGDVEAREVGDGTLTAPSTFTRDNIAFSTNGGSAVSWASGTKYILCSLNAEALA